MLDKVQSNNIIRLSFSILTFCLILTFIVENKNPEIALTVIGTFALLILSAMIKDIKDIKVGNIISITKQEIKEQVKQEIQKENENAW